MIEPMILPLSKVIDYFADVSGPFKIYPNPMRSDGVFIGQDKLIEPYPGVSSLGNQIYPATPFNAKCFPIQIPIEMAEDALKVLNGSTSANAGE